MRRCALSLRPSRFTRHAVPTRFFLTDGAARVARNASGAAPPIAVSRSVAISAALSARL